MLVVSWHFVGGAWVVSRGFGVLVGRAGRGRQAFEGGETKVLLGPSRWPWGAVMRYVFPLFSCVSTGTCEGMQATQHTCAGPTIDPKWWDSSRRCSEAPTRLHEGVHCQQQGCAANLSGFSVDDSRPNIPSVAVNKKYGILFRSYEDLLQCKRYIVIYA